MMKYLSVFIVLVFLCGCASQQMAFQLYLDDSGKTRAAACAGHGGVLAGA